MDLSFLRAAAPDVELHDVVGRTSTAISVRGSWRGRPVVVRFLVDPHRDPKALAKLAESLAERGALVAPGLVAVLAAGPSAEPPYVIEAPVEGETLAARVAAGGRVDALRLGRELAEALVAIAERGLTHGALSPEVVWVDASGQARLGGLGEARVLAPEGDAARGEQEAYLAPEELAGRRSGIYADLYALGLVLCEAAAGRPLFGEGVALRVTPGERLGGWAPGPDLVARMGPRLAMQVNALLDPKPAHRPLPAWVAAHCTRPGPTPGRTALALAPVVALFIAMVALLVTSVMRDLGHASSTPVQVAVRPVPRTAPARPPEPIARKSERDADFVRLLARAEALLRQQHYAEAEALFVRCTVIDRKSDEALTGLACALEGEGRLADAEVRYRASLELAPRDPFALLRLGHLRDKRGDVQDAELLTRKALDALPRYGCARLQLASLRLRAGDAAEATRLIAEERADDPPSGHAANHLGHAYELLRDAKSAEAYLRRGVEPVDVAPTTWIELAFFLEHQDRVTEALALVQEVAAKTNDRADALAIASRLLARSKRINDAGNALAEALKMDPGPEQLEQVARTLIRTNSTPRRAEQLLKTALARDPLDHDAYEDLADVYLAVDASEEAAVAAKHGLALAPRCPRCVAALALARKERLTAVQAEPLEPADPMVEAALAETALADGNAKAAREHLAYSLEREPGNRVFLKIQERMERGTR